MDCFLQTAMIPHDRGIAGQTTERKYQLYRNIYSIDTYQSLERRLATGRRRNGRAPMRALRAPVRRGRRRDPRHLSVLLLGDRRRALSGHRLGVAPVAVDGDGGSPHRSRTGRPGAVTPAPLGGAHSPTSDDSSSSNSCLRRRPCPSRRWRLTVGWDTPSISATSSPVLSRGHSKNPLK